MFRALATFILSKCSPNTITRAQEGYLGLETTTISTSPFHHHATTRILLWLT
jgi:hypothetical protein